MAFFGVVLTVDASTDTKESDSTQEKTVTKTEPVMAEATVNSGAITTDSVMNDLIQVGSDTSFTKEPEEVFAKITTYGTDCNGCYNSEGFGGTAGGVKLSFTSVCQSNGSWQDGITYDGYYVVAANSSIPFGSIVEVSNHGFSGNGLIEGQTFYAMVLDRGAMTLNHLDLFVGSEKNNSISINRNYRPTMKIVRYGY